MEDGSVIIFDGIYSFKRSPSILMVELLSGFRFFLKKRSTPSPSGGGWHAVPLPKPPVGQLVGEHKSAHISAFFAVGARVCISPKGHLLSLDTGEHGGAWRAEGTFPSSIQSSASPRIPCIYARTTSRQTGTAPVTRAARMERDVPRGVHQQRKQRTGVQRQST
jgi:hypothetical protein